MANTILTPTAVTREALRVLHQKLNFVGSINRQYDDQYAKTGAKIGSDLKIRLPNEYTVRTGAVMDVQDTTESSTTLTVSTQKGVDLNFTSVDLTLSLDDFSKRILEPAMSVLAANVENDALDTMRKQVWKQVDNTSAVATYAKLLEGRRRLNDSLTPLDNRTALLNSADGATLIDVLKGLFNPTADIAKQYREGYMGRTGGFDFEESTLLSTQARGAGASYQTNSVTAQTGATLVVDTGTGAINVGEVITIAGVNRVHPETKADTGILQQFVVTSTDATNATSIGISPSIVASGASQNVTNAAANDKAVTIMGTASTNYGQSLLYHKDAFTFATADLVMPSGMDFASREVMDGISMRIVRQYDINNDKFPCRLDVLYGYKMIRGQLACRLANLAPA